MLENGADKDINKVVEYGNHKGWTPLAIACDNINFKYLSYEESGHEVDREKIVESLLEYGADKDVNKVVEDGDYKNWTPLAIACKNSDKKIVKLLLSKGATIDQKSLEKAKSKDSKKLLQLLELVQAYDKARKDGMGQDFISKQNKNDKDLLLKRSLAIPEPTTIPFSEKPIIKFGDVKIITGGANKMIKKKRNLENKKKLLQKK